MPVLPLTLHVFVLLPLRAFFSRLRQPDVLIQPLPVFVSQLALFSQTLLFGLFSQTLLVSLSD